MCGAAHRAARGFECGPTSDCCALQGAAVAAGEHPAGLFVFHHVIVFMRLSMDILHTTYMQVASACLTASCKQLKLPFLAQDNRTQAHGGSKNSAQQLERIIDILLTDRYRCPGTNHAPGRHAFKHLQIAFRLQPMQLDGHIDCASWACRLHMGALSAGTAPSRRAAASICNWALQPVEVAVGLRVSRMGVCSRS